MDAITIGQNKHSSDEVEFLSNRQYFQQDSIEKLNNHQETKVNKKKVHFNINTTIFKHQAFENTEQNSSEINRTQKLNYEDHDYIPSPTNIFTFQLPESNDESICSARGTIITFIITVVIIIAAAIAVGIVFATIKASQNTTKNSYQSSFLTVSATVMTSSVNIGSQNGAPCSSYTTINDPSRNVTQAGFDRPCDDGPLFNASGNGAWIRFIGSGGEIMAISSPGTNHCGSFATGWFNSTLPTILGTTVNGTVCFTMGVTECAVSYQTSVVYCNGSFYVYFLRPPGFCNARYCTT